MLLLECSGPLQNTVRESSHRERRLISLVEWTVATHMFRNGFLQPASFVHELARLASICSPYSNIFKDLLLPRCRHRNNDAHVQGPKKGSHRSSPLKYPYFGLISQTKQAVTRPHPSASHEPTHVSLSSLSTMTGAKRNN